jgi:hypothetical protein
MPARCTGILVSMPEDANQLPPVTAATIPNFGQILLKFVQLIQRDHEYADDSLNKSCIGLLGDLCGLPGMAPEINKPETIEWIKEFLKANPKVDANTRMYAQSRLQGIGCA